MTTTTTTQNSMFDDVCPAEAATAEATEPAPPAQNSLFGGERPAEVPAAEPIALASLPLPTAADNEALAEEPPLDEENASEGEQIAEETEEATTAGQAPAPEIHGLIITFMGAEIHRTDNPNLSDNELIRDLKDVFPELTKLPLPPVQERPVVEKTAHDGTTRRYRVVPFDKKMGENG